MQCAYTRGEGKGVRCEAESTHGFNGKDYCRPHMLFLRASAPDPRGGAVEPRGGRTESRGGATGPRGGVEDDFPDEQYKDRMEEV